MCTQARSFDAIAQVGKILSDIPKNELRSTRENEVVADYISHSPSRRPWWLCAEVVLTQSDIATFILFY